MAKLSSSIKNAGMNSGAKVIARMRKVSELKCDPAFSGIFQIKDEILTAIIRSMKESGYDKAEPIVIWKGKDIVVDGYTRLKAAIEAGIPEIPVEEKEFSSLEEAVRYAKKRQLERRNLSQGEILAAASKLENKSDHDGSGRSSELLAKELGVSPSTIQHARTVLTQAPPDVVEQVKQNKLTINKAYKATKEAKQPQKPVPDGTQSTKYTFHTENYAIADINQEVQQAFFTLSNLLAVSRQQEKIPHTFVIDIAEALKPFLGKLYNSETIVISPTDTSVTQKPGDIIESET